MRRNKERSKGYRKWLFKHLYKQLHLVVLVLIGIFFVSLTLTLIPIIIGDIIDNVLLVRDLANLLVMLAIGLIVSLLYAFSDYGVMMLGHFLGLKVEKKMRQEFFDTIQLKPLSYHDNVRTGDLLALATNDVRVINTMLAHGSFFIYPFMQIFITIYLLIEFLDYRLAIICIPFIFSYIYFVFNYRKRLSPYVTNQMTQYSNLAVVIQDSISGASVVRAFNAENLERKKFNRAVQSFKNIFVGKYKVQAKYYPLLALNLVIGSTFFIGSIFVFQETLNVGDLVATNLLLIALLEPTSMIHWSTNDMMSGFAACSRLYNSLIKGESEVRPSEYAEWPKQFKGKIEFKNVTFTHQNNNGNQRPTLNNLNFTIEPFQRVALVGPTGCGKSTLAKLILSLYRPQNGSILLDGEDIQNYPLETLRKNIGYIEQEIYLYPRSIKENIIFGKPEASEEDMLNAAKLAQVDEFVRDFPKGYETIVGERGTRLSGGEKQRVAIARAFLTDPAILILDDSVSAVDSETEERIGRAMENILKNRTTIIITHRLHTIRTSDKIIVLKRGELVAEGNHKELIQSSEDYRRIFGKKLTLTESKINVKRG
ncbi:MAG: ABC transporter ATP-binding protein [Candidatus Lokiarchaeota archaeon]|nr:ABC transporter ATP-binding protein [Candidatus Lokiarchaeota archaeon]